MDNRRLQFGLFSGGTLTVDLTKCATCKEKLCVVACGRQGKPSILELDHEGKPRLNITMEAAAAGGCVECLGCEFECSLHGEKAIRIKLNMKTLNEIS